MNHFRSFLLFSILVTSQTAVAQDTPVKAGPLVLFIDEDVPKSAVKVATRKIKEPYEGYRTFEEAIIKYASKNNCNLAKLDEYHAPDKKKPEHQGMVSIYRLDNIDSLQEAVGRRRDSLDQVQLSQHDENCLVYFFRPRTMIKTPYDLVLDGRVVMKMKPDSTFIVRPGDKRQLSVSARILSSPTSFTMQLKPGKIYYVECRTIGSTFTMFPLFSRVDSHVGRYLVHESGQQTK